MSVINQNQEIDSLKIVEQPDGSFQMEWDPMDKKWSVLNDLTPEEIRAMLMEEIARDLNDC